MSRKNDGPLSRSQLVFIIGFVASLIGIFTFLTGKMSLPEILRDITRAGTSQVSTVTLIPTRTVTPVQESVSPMPIKPTGNVIATSAILQQSPTVMTLPSTDTPNPPTVKPTETQALPTRVPVIPSSTVAPTSVTQHSTSQSRISSARVGGGTGTILGRVIWNNAPFENILVKFGVGFPTDYLTSVVTGSDGRFRFTEVPTGQFVIDTQTDLTTGLILVRGVPQPKVSVGQTVDIGDYEVSKTDLQILSPSSEDVLPAGNMTVRWKAYPNATSYEVFIWIPVNNVWNIAQRANVKGDTTAVFSLGTGVYMWGVNAYGVKPYNANQMPIAESWPGNKFTVR